MTMLNRTILCDNSDKLLNSVLTAREFRNAIYKQLPYQDSVRQNSAATIPQTRLRIS